jgi:methylenetetrahydrofolate reductase (NADPH)
MTMPDARSVTDMTRTAVVTRSPAESRTDTVAQITAFAHGFSLETTRPSATDIAALQAIAPPATPVYLSAIPTRALTESIASAVAVRAAGFEPVPHVAARLFANAAALDDHLARLAGEAGVTRVLVIAGDRADPAGEFMRAIDVIDRASLARHQILNIGIAGYPEGHPRIAQLDLDRALNEKVAAAESAGLAVHIVTQFSFDAQAIIAWVRRLRDFGLEHTVRIGLAGPTSLPTLLRYAARCGVKASAQGLARQAGLMRRLFGMSTPDGLVRALAEAHAHGQLGDVAPHYFSFGGLPATARWATATANGRIALDNGGFAVESD